MVIGMKGTKIMKWHNRPGEVGGVPQDEFDKITAEVTARARYARGEHGTALSCPLKKVN